MPRNEVVDLLGVEENQRRQLGARVGAVVELHVRQAQHDAVVGGHRLDLDAVTLAHARGDAERPGGVHGHTERGVDRDAPVADLVAEAFDDQGGVGGDMPGRGLLLGEVGHQVVRCPGVQAGGAGALQGLLRGRAGEFAHERPDGAAELGGAPLGLALPEGQAPGLARSRGDQHLVVGDLLDPPTGRAQREHIAHARLVDHLFVEFPDSAPGSVTGQEDAEESPVGDGAAAGHGEVLGAAAGGDGVGEAIPHDAWPQLGELIARVAPGKHVEDGVEHGAAQRGVGRAPPQEGVQVAHGPLIECHDRDNLLREHIEGIGRDPHRLDAASAHALDDDGALHEITAVLREEHPVRRRPHLVAGSADALEAAGDRRR